MKNYFGILHNNKEKSLENLNIYTKVKLYVKNM